MWELNFAKFMSFRQFRENCFPLKLLDNCRFAKFSSRKNSRFFKHGNQVFGYPCKCHFNHLRKNMAADVFLAKFTKFVSRKIFGINFFVNINCCEIKRLPTLKIFSWKSIFAKINSLKVSAKSKLPNFMQF